MESLLRWGIENSSPPPSDQAAAPSQPRQHLDTAIIDHILGKPDAVLMKEALAVAVDEKSDEDERVESLDNLEMLVESIDNANDLGKLQMWKPLQDLLINPSTPSSIKTQTLWVIGTAVQNNPSAQSSYLALSPIPILLSFLEAGDTSAQTRSKAVYALSGLLKHNAAAIQSLSTEGGWVTLKSALNDSDITVRRKTAFMLNTLLLPTHPPTTSGPAAPFLAIQDGPLPSSPATGTSSTSTSAALHVPTEASPNVVHPNSHASMLSDPSSTSTSPLVLKAMREEGVLESVLDALVTPVPFGVDGEVEEDVDFEEKCVRILHTYAVSCGVKFTPKEKTKLKHFFDEQSTKAGGDANLAERWGTSIDELDALKRQIH